MKKHLAFLISLIAAVFIAKFAEGQSNFTGLGDGTSWEDAANWDNGVPLGVNANIGDGFTVELSSNQFVNELDLVGDQSAGSAVLNHATGTMDNAGWLKVGVNAGNEGTYNMTGDAATNYGVLYIGHFGGTATLDLSDDSVLNGGGLNAGLHPDALVTINIADNATFNVTDINLGNGALNQTSGQVTASSWIAISKDGASGAYNISGGSLTQTPDANDWISVGEALDGVMRISGNAVVNANSNGMIVGRFEGGVGLLEITGSNATVNVQDLRVGIDDMGMDTTATGTLSWIADASGVTPVTSADNTEFGSMDSTLLVDLTASDDFASYGPKGKIEEILLIDNATPVTGTFNGLAEGASVSIGGGKTAQVSYVGGDGNDIVLKVMIGDDVLLGDVNCDGSVDLLDVQPFVDLLTAGGFSAKADINQDGEVNLLDVEPFVDLLSGG